MSNGDSGTKRGGLLDLIEVIGNKLPDPSTLFLLGTIVVGLVSWLAVQMDWHVVQKLPVQMMETVELGGEPIERPALDDEGNPLVEWRIVMQTEDVNELDADGNIVTTAVETDEEVVLRARSLLTREGLFWVLESMVDNFMAFPPLGVVLVGMLGIGVAERTGMIGALLKAFMLVVPGKLLTPAMIFIGIMSSMAMDAGYVVLPPLAAALYKAVGRSPLAGLAAVFAGVSAGFNANLFITGLDPMLAGFATTGGQVIDPTYEMNPACNWYFMVASTALITAAGWATTSLFVERRLATKPPEEGGPVVAAAGDLNAQRLSPGEVRGLKIAFATLVGVLALFLAAILVPNWFLNGKGIMFDRWVEAIVPMIFLVFVTPGIAYGVSMKAVQNDKDVAKLFVESMASMAPIIVLAFFAAQFIEAFKWSGLDRMLAMAGGQALGQADLPAGALIVVFILVTVFFNLFIGSMSAKYAMFAPIFIPMFMMVGISPELTQAAYRIGDSVSNIITPLNAYLIIILVFMQKFVPKGGMGTLISTMLPYTIVFTIIWTIFLLLWMQMGWNLGPDGPLTYIPTG